MDKIIPDFIIKYLQKALHLTDNTRNKGFPSRPYIYTREDAKKIYDIVLSGMLHHTSGQEVKLLEREFAQYHKARYALATNAGTSALELALKAIGIKPGDEVIVPAYTFVATAQAVLSRGGIPIFADIDDTFTISPTSLASCITQKTKAIIPVHMFGNVADMDRILTIAKRYNLFVVEDACQAIGARYNAKHVGTLGDIGCFSFNEKKAISTGQGGMLITSQKKYYDIASITRDTGQAKDEIGSDVVTTGNTFAMTEMQAALARSILKQLDVLNGQRRQSYRFFIEHMNTRSLPLCWYRILPRAEPSFSRLVFLIDFDKLNISRKTFVDMAQSTGIPLRTFYPVPLYAYSLFRQKKDSLTQNNYPFSLNPNLRYPKKLPFVEIFCKQQVGIEFSPYLTQKHLRYFCETFRHEVLKHLL